MLASTAPALPRATRRERTGVAAAVALLHLGLGYLLLLGLHVDLSRHTERALAVFDLTAPPPPLFEPRASPAARTELEGRAAPPALHARPKPVVAPQPPTPLPVPTIAAALVAASGPDLTAGAAPRPGPGIGVAGTGDGPGGGGQGDGVGSGLAVRALRIAGEIRNRDYPRTAARTREQGDVVAHLVVDARGRVAACEVARSSGSPELDAATCRLIRERFRYRPALDRNGQPIPDELGWRQSWWLAR